MKSTDAKEKKELSNQELEQVAGGAIQQPRNESAQPNPDPSLTPDTPALLVDEPGLGNPAEGFTEV